VPLWTLTYLLSYSMEQSPSWEANRFSGNQQIPPHFIEPESSLPHSQVPTTCPYPEPARSSPYPQILLALFPLSRLYQSISPCSMFFKIVRNKIRFYGEELLEPRPTSKLQDHPLSAVRDCLFNIFAATLHIGSRFSIRKLRTRHAVVTRTRFSRPFWR
jgi:hypothetical protein